MLFTFIPGVGEILDGVEGKSELLSSTEYYKTSLKL
ncbi:unnamed protein product, partial [marine sediment metagenome]